MGQHNFTALKENLDGCYRLAEDIRLQGDQALQLPIGNRSHPFTGSLDGDVYSLSLNLTRLQGDALLFGSIDHSRIHLAMTDSQLVTLYGSRAALIGTMGSDNLVLIARLHNSLFNATGEGTVEAGLVAATTGTGNRLRLHDAEDNTLVARSFPGSGHRAHVSLGLGVVSGSGSQVVEQDWLEGNRLQAVADAPSAGWTAGQGSRPHKAITGLLGLLDSASTGQTLRSRQQAVRSNVLTAFAQGGADWGGHSCLSLGYAGVDCGQPGSLADWNRTLWMSQADCLANNLLSVAPARRKSAAVAEAPERGSLARASLVSTEAVGQLHLLQRSLSPGQIEVVVAAEVQKAVLPPTRHAHVVLLSGGDDSLPLFGRWGGVHECSVTNGRAGDRIQPGDSLLDTAGYRAQDFNCHQNGTKATPVVDTRRFADWRRAHYLFAAFEQGLAGRTLPNNWHDKDTGLHYPHEAVQSLVRINRSFFGRTWWYLVTRQTYPWQKDSALGGGLIRSIRYLAPDADHPLPHSTASTQVAFQLNQARAGDPALDEGAPVQQLDWLQLYQAPGRPAQLVALRGWVTDEPYRLSQYDELAGQARLLSMEDGEPHLWMQQDDKDILMVYGLGAQAPATRQSAWLHRGFDLSDQPGGRVLLARAGAWLYSVRQEAGQPASLRRWHFGSGKMDPLWQPAWPGNVTDGLRLVVDSDQLVALPTATLVDPRQRATGLQAQIPYEGGPLKWQRVTLVRQPVPVEPHTGLTWGTVARSSAPSSAAGTRAPEEQAGNDRFVHGFMVSFGPLAVLSTAGLGVGACVCASIVVKIRRNREAARAEANARQPGDAPSQVPAISCTFSEETAV